MPDREWTSEELRAAVESYLEMQSLYRSGRPFVKKDYYRALAARFDRTEKAFEYRAQNISHVLALLGRDWLPGLPPARNVGAHRVRQIEGILAEIQGSELPGEASFEVEVRAALNAGLGVQPTGQARPRTSKVLSTVYERDPRVKAWVLQAADGKCESCEEPAPFLTHDDFPFLEVHHVHRLADGGSDTVDNAVALCPNCHRALHFARNRAEIAGSLYRRLQRLRRSLPKAS